MRDETTFNFSGPFRDVMPLYIKYRRSLGYKVAESELYRMKELDVFFERHGITEPCIPREMYDKWTSLRDGERPVTVCRRRSVIRGLGRYLSAAGCQDVYAGEDDKRCFESDYIPYVFTRDEIKRIFSEMDSACLEKPSFLNHSFRLIISLCYCCGLRKSEAVSLKAKDVDFRTGKINVLNSKRDVSRIIVASGSLLKIMEKTEENNYKKNVIHLFYQAIKRNYARAKFNESQIGLMVEMIKKSQENFVDEEDYFELDERLYQNKLEIFPEGE